MDALEILREQHLDARSAFEQIEQASPDQRGALWAKLRAELKAHEQMRNYSCTTPWRVTPTVAIRC
jgi:hypothetical protein